MLVTKSVLAKSRPQTIGGSLTTAHLTRTASVNQRLTDALVSLSDLLDVQDGFLVRVRGSVPESVIPGIDAQDDHSELGALEERLRTLEYNLARLRTINDSLLNIA